MTTTTTATHWLIERLGDRRQCWGPYNPSQAKREAGSRHLVVTDPHGHLTNGGYITAHALRILVHCGGLVVQDGTSIDGL